MVKPLKPLFFSENPLKTIFEILKKTFIFKKSCFSSQINIESVMLS